ncbi:DUF4185 domain-containing protein [Luteipulveratus sp. YIM 133132]|uniref:DUF4185 domain-containing protein n=1 Tax=Luteipulveratus flavus TaxID=3031728 RepID=A0ABT6C8G0_9MICO|nr:MULTISPECIES: DUF4185 domain-containing protein [unclassified Luteipulveratus]MDE9366127.1 DUF4185 domain-containing protein [Luteipulveratus sp. YIM 133132]MDF8265219.1 DUF4185 domain-containing protein [Luteipulveratus sp. YIM 133296]
MPRSRTRRAVLAAALGALLLAGCAEPEPGLQVEVSGASRSGGTADASVPPGGDGSTVPRLPPICAPPKPGRTYDTAQLNATMTQLDLPDWRAADVGATAPLTDGRVLWVFGDTLRAAGSRPGLVANSLLVSSGTCFTQVGAGRDTALLGVPEDGEACWPTSVASRAVIGGDEAFVICSRVQRKPAGLLDFSYLGASLIRITVASGGQPVIRDVTSLTPDTHDETVVNWGAGQLIDGGWLYVYGSQQGRGATSKSVLVARVRLAQASRFMAWQFYDGRRWQEDAGWARPVLPANPGVSQAFSVHRDGNHFVLVSKRGGEFGDAIGVWTAPTPAGPWSLASQTPYPYDDGSGFVSYQPLAHPELPLRNGRLLVTMSRNPTSFENLLAQPRRGRPVFVEVPKP